MTSSTEYEAEEWKQELEQLFRNGETDRVEFKRCGGSIGNDIMETICAFQNRLGGDIFLGVEDNGTVVGIPEKAASDLQRQLTNRARNQNEMQPAAYIEPTILSFEGKTIIRVHVPAMPDVHAFKGVVYDRVGESDVRVTAASELGLLYLRKSSQHSEKRIFPYAELADLQMDMLPEIRTMAANTAGNGRRSSPWLKLTDEELLRYTGLYQRNLETNEQGLTLAAILLLGKDETIRSAAPAYVTDAILQRKNTIRYDDREFITSNLVQAYERLVGFVDRSLPDKFFLEDDLRRVSLLGVLAREMAANVLIHREYGADQSARLVIERDRMFTENANRSPSNRRLTPSDTRAEQKNPVIAGFFRAIGYAEQLGSGVRNVFRYAPLYSGKEPVFLDADTFQLIVPLDDAFAAAGMPEAENKRLKSNVCAASPPTEPSEEVYETELAGTVGNVTQKEAALPDAEGKVAQKDTASPKTDDKITQKKPISPKTGDDVTQKTAESPEIEGRIAQKNAVSPKTGDKITQKKPISPEIGDDITQKTAASHDDESRTAQKDAATPKTEDGVVSPKSTSSESDLGAFIPDPRGLPLRTGHDQYDAVLACLAADPTVTQAQIAQRLSMTRDQIKYYFGILKKHGWITRVGSRRSGTWTVQHGTTIK